MLTVLSVANICRPGSRSGRKSTRSLLLRRFWPGPNWSWPKQGCFQGGWSGFTRLWSGITLSAGRISASRTECFSAIPLAAGWTICRVGRVPARTPPAESRCGRSIFIPLFRRRPVKSCCPTRVSAGTGRPTGSTRVPRWLSTLGISPGSRNGSAVRAGRSTHTGRSMPQSRRRSTGSPGARRTASILTRSPTVRRFAASLRPATGHCRPALCRRNGSTAIWRT